MEILRVTFCPMDVVLFRDPRPFEVGGYAKSYRIPLPSTFSGAIRSLLREVDHSKNDIENMYKDDKYLRWKLHGPFPTLIKEGEGGFEVDEFYPIPSDVFEFRKKDAVVLVPSEPYSYEVDGCELLTPPRLKEGEILERPEKDLLSKDVLLNYLKGKTISRSEMMGFEKLFDRIERPGVKLIYKVVEFGKFYRIEALEAKRELEDGKMVRAGYTARISGDGHVLDKIEKTCKGKKVLRFGGESRPSLIFVKKKDVDKKWEEAKRTIADRIVKEGKFKVYLATPAIFMKDEYTSRWIPKWINKVGSEFSGKFMGEGPRVKLEGVSIGKRIGISGWDYAKNYVKPMYSGVPAGSVFYFKLEEGVSCQDVVEKIINRLELNNISDIMPALGFGTAFVGVW